METNINDTTLTLTLNLTFLGKKNKGKKMTTVLTPLAKALNSVAAWLAEKRDTVMIEKEKIKRTTKSLLVIVILLIKNENAIAIAKKK